MTAPAEPSVTIAILTFNGAPHLGAILDRIAEQRYRGPVDVLVIDSGSTDDTLEIVAAHPGVRLHSIPNVEFGHGITRDLAVRLASGDVVAFLTHDAVPASDYWLHELVLPLADDERIAAVLGKQVPRADAPPIVAYDIQRAFERMGPDYAIGVVWDTGRKMSDAERWAASFHSDANAAVRRRVVLGPVPFRDVDYAEDQRLARDLLDAGYRRAYAPRAAVEHSNETTLRTFGGRVMADLLALRRLGVAIAPISRRHAMQQWLRWSLADAGRLIVDRRYSAPRRVLWLLVTPLWHAVKWSAYRRASRLAL